MIHCTKNDTIYFHVAVKLEFHGTDTDTDTNIRDAPIMKFCKRVHDSLSCTVHVRIPNAVSYTHLTLPTIYSV